MLTGYTWTYSPTTKATIWHLFRGTLTICGTRYIEELTQDELEPEVLNIPGRRYCRLCEKILRIEQQQGLAPEPALSDEDKDFIRAHWLTHTETEITQMLGRTNVRRIGEWASSYCQKKGTNSGTFKKGQTPATAKPGINETIRNDKRGVPYYHVRGGKYGWQYKHVALWEEANGKLPAGHCVAFKDGNTMNCVLENLECVTRAENLLRNSGRGELTDKYVSHQLSRVGGGPGMRFDPEVQQIALQMPELLGAKRAQLQLNRTLKSLSDDTR